MNEIGILKEFDKLGRIVIPKDAETVGTYTVNYADLDQNRHMNNTHYPNMLCDFTPDIFQKRVTGMTLSFLHEATFDHTLTVHRTAHQDGFAFRTVDEDGNACLEASLSLGDREGFTAND